MEITKINRQVQELLDRGLIREILSMESSRKYFEEMKNKVIKSPVLALPYFENVFQVECDAR